LHVFWAGLGTFQWLAANLPGSASASSSWELVELLVLYFIVGGIGSASSPEASMASGSSTLPLGVALPGFIYRERKHLRHR
jgi:hypothetical protein